MKKKVFSLMMTLLLAFVGVAKADVVEIGDGNGTTYYFPIDNYFNYSCTEQIYLASEIGTAGTINAISFYYNYGTAYTANNVTMYMKHVSRSAFASTSDCEALASGDIVWTGAIAPTAAGWYTFTLDTPFEYNGTDNLLVAFFDGTSGYPGTSYTWRQTTSPNSAYMALRYYSDSSTPDPYNLSSYSGSKTWYTYRGNIQIDITPGGGAGGGEPATLLVHDGTATNGNVPVYGFYADAYLKCEMVYPAAELSDMNGGTINAITFYATTPATEAWTSTWQVFVSEVADATISSFYGPGTVVYEGALDGTGTEMTINFTTPYQYNGGNLLVGVYNIATGNYKSVTWAGESVTGAAWQGYNYSSLSAVTGSAQNFLPKTNFDYVTAGGGQGGGTQNVIFALQDGVEVETVQVGPRPSGAWMEPFTFQLRNDGPATILNLIDFTPTDYFTVVGPELPVEMDQNEEIDIQLTTGTSTDTLWQMVAIYGEGRTARVWDIKAEPYTPGTPDVWELACTQATSFPFVEVPATAHHVTLYDNYTLPFPEIPEGYDAVYKLVFADDMNLDAEVTSGADGKVALYTEDFYGEGGPMATNSYNGPTAGAGGAGGGAPFEAQIGEGTSTSGYFPFYTLYNYSIAENLYLATELVEAGVTTAPMNSLSWYATNTTGYEQQGITIWMANVEDEALTTTSHITTGMTKVYTGAMTPLVGWNEFVFNEGSFAWDGHSNVLIYCQRNNGAWNSTINWQATTAMPFTCMAYRYQDSGAYDETVANTMYTSTTRPNIIMKSMGRTDTPDPNANLATGTAEISYGPVITDAPVAAGTYYLVASSTDQDFEVTINAVNMPCPVVDGFNFGVIPADDAADIEPNVVELKWNNPANATEYQVVFGSTYHPEANHPQTVISDWMPVSGATGSFYVTNLWNNTNYFWHVVFRNNGACAGGVSSPVWGFTTHLNAPHDLEADDETIFNDETVTLTWSSVVDRTYRQYFVYRDGVKIGETTMNQIGETTYTDGPLAYNMGGYEYYVTAVYDEGESAPSNTVNVKVSGYTNNTGINGYVYEQDGTTGIAGATVTLTGADEFGDPHIYTATTDETGYYNKCVYAGTYTDAIASKEGYQAVQTNHVLPFVAAHDGQVDDVNFVMDENFVPVCQVMAQYYPDSLDPASPYVKVYWGCGLPGFEITEDFESGDFNSFDWQNDPTYPWSISTTNPYEGTYCMKSGGAGVANVVSNMTVTVDISSDGLMSFFGKISSENNWDYGYFYIDGVQKGSYTGAGSWTEYNFDITAGTHTFQWRYTKDGSLNSNEDCFYVDYISFYKQPERSNDDPDSRHFSHYRVYRTDCYNDGPYTLLDEAQNAFGNTRVLGCEVTDTVFIDTYWNDPQFTQPGVYKWGVGVVYVGNRGEEIEGPISWTEPISVEPEMATRQTVTIGDGTSTNYYSPYNSLWGYSFVEQVYTAAEIGTPGVINAISFNLRESDASQTNQIDVFMKNVSRTNFASNSDWESVTASDMVFSGTVTFNPGWSTIVLDTPFQYDGTSNLMIGIHEYTSGYSTRYFYHSSVPGGLISGHSDSVNPDPFNMGSYTGTMYTQNYRANIQLDITAGGGGGSIDPGIAGGNEPVQEPRESVIVWSNCLDKDMYLDHVSVNVLLNSADSPEGTLVRFTNYNQAEQQNYPVADVTLDDSGYYLWDNFRKGEYRVDVQLDGYAPITDSVSIWSTTDLRYVLTELFYGVENIYVSRTGWAMWDDSHNVTGGGGGQGGGTSFTEDFESGIPTDWTLIDADGDGNNWYDLIGNNPNNIPGHNNSIGFATSASYNGSILYPDNYLVTPQVTLGGSFSFWACGQDASYAAEHFGVAVSTNGNSSANDFTTIQEWTLTAKSLGAPTSETRSGNRVQGAWYQYTVDLSSYAGQTGYVAIRHFGCHDMFRINVDDVVMGGAKSEANDRHFEYYKVMCTSIDGVPIFNHNTVHPFCQLSYNEPYNAPLVEGEHYLCKVACMYTTGMGAWSEPVEWVYEPCEHWGPVDEVSVNTASQGNHIEWVFDHGYNPYDPGTGGGGQGGGDDVTIILTAGDVWGDGTGYQMLLDPTHSLYGTTIPTTGALSTNCSGNEGIYNQFEYKIPTNADGNCSTQNIVINNSVSITIPAGTYDWCVTNPTPGDRIWIAAANGNVGGRQDDYVFEAGNTYEFTCSMFGSNDGVNVTVTGGAKNRVSPLASGEVKDIANVVPGDYGYIVRPLNNTSNMVGQNFVMTSETSLTFSITDITYFDERMYFLYNLMNDSRFDVVVAENDGNFVVNASNAYANLDLEEAFSDFSNENANQFAQLSKEELVEMTMTYKDNMPNEYVVSVMSDMIVRSRENDHCEEALPFCTEMETYQYPASSGQPSSYHDPLSQQEGGPIDFSCLSTQPNQAWYYFRIDVPGQLNIRIETNPSQDIDFCCWGPFDDPLAPCPNGLTTDKVSDCSFSAAHVENCMIPGTYSSHMPQTGEYYILVLTNYSAQPTEVTFWSMGDATTDCNIVVNTDVIGFLITQDGEYLAFAGPDDREYTHEGEFGEHEYCVRPIYPGEMTLPDHNYGWSMGCPVCQGGQGGDFCEAGAAIHGEPLNGTDQVKIWWGEENPGPGPQGATSFTEDFEGGLNGWNVLTVLSDGGSWIHSNDNLGGYDYTSHAHSGSGFAMCYSFVDYVGSFNTDSYIYTPQKYDIVNGSTLTFWADNANDSYPENFSVCVATADNPTASDFTQVWSGGAKGGAAKANNRHDANRYDNWRSHTIDLSAYAGQSVYIAFHDVNYDMYEIWIDDVELTAGAKNRAGIESYNVYRSTENANYTLIGNVPAVAGQTYYEYIDTPATAGSYYYQVTAVYAACESEPAAAYDTPANNYVMVSVDNVNEDGNEVAIYPNPTKGNVTIEATGMNHITVVSVLGQVVYDAEVDADHVTLNMNQFNAGMYTVRVSTAEGVAVRRVTVIR